MAPPFLKCGKYRGTRAPIHLDRVVRHIGYPDAALVASSTAMLSMPTPSLATILSCGEAAMAVAETIAQFVMIAEGLCSRTRQSISGAGEGVAGPVTSFMSADSMICRSTVSSGQA